MSSNVKFYFDEEPRFPIVVKFILKNDENITIGGNSVSHVFFEFSRRFPEKIQCKAIEFSGETKEESEMYLREFLVLAKKYNNL